MKTFYLSYLSRLAAPVIGLSLSVAWPVTRAQAQLPDCTSGNVMYGVFNNLAGSTTADSMEIRPVTYATGAVGALMGGKKYWIRKQIGTTYYYGSSALGVCLVNNRFYVITQMSGSGGAKDIVAIDPVAATTTVVATMPTSLNNYHFVKLAISPDGNAYAIGVNRDTTQPANTFNPLVKFSTCGATPSLNCANTSVTVLGYLPSTGNMYKWKLFNGDLAFDKSGNLYFATAAYENVGTSMAYTNARLFKINVVDIPTAAGTGTIPMTFLADYPMLDSTVINGIALDVSGNMYVSTRRYNGPQNSVPPPSTTIELYKSTNPGVAAQLSAFTSPTPNFSIADLASCNFPATILAVQQVRLGSRTDGSKAVLKWEVQNNADINNFELQRSDDGNNFTTLSSIPANNPDPSFSRYSYTDDEIKSAQRFFYRIRAIMKTGVRVYSNVENLLININAVLLKEAYPNPFIDQVRIETGLKTDAMLDVRIMDGAGRLVYQGQFSGLAGENKLSIGGLSHLGAGIFVLEIKIREQVIRTRLVKG